MIYLRIVKVITLAFYSNSELNELSLFMLILKLRALPSIESLKYTNQASSLIYSKKAV